MLVDVVIPIYKCAAYVSDALDSVIAQKTDKIAQIRIINDGSTDNSLQIISEYQRRHPNLITVHSRGFNVGFMRSRREGIEYCDAEFITCLDSDDQWTDPDKIEIMVQFMRDHPEAAYCGHAIEIVKDKLAEFGVAPYNGVDIYPDILPYFNKPQIIDKIEFLKTTGCGFHVNAFMGRREVIRKFLSPQLDYITNQDAYLCFFSAEYGEVGFIPRVMANYRLRGGSGWAILSETNRALQILTGILKIYNGLKDPQIKEVAQYYVMQTTNWWLATVTTDGVIDKEKFSQLINSGNEELIELVLNP